MSGGLSTHVLDLALGLPAANVPVRLSRGADVLFTGATNADGRCPNLLGASALKAGRYQLTFDIAAYFEAIGGAARGAPFFPTATLTFEVSDPGRHHHVPLLLSPFGYSTYRGS